MNKYDENWNKIGKSFDEQRKKRKEQKRKVIINNIKPVFVNIDYYCSENSLATLLTYYGSKINPVYLHYMGCTDFNNIRKCVPSFYKHKKNATIKNLKNSINEYKPVLVSVIPDSNLENMEKHTIVLYGYDFNNFYSIDNGKKVKINFDVFLTEWKRTKRDSYIINNET